MTQPHCSCALNASSAQNLRNALDNMFDARVPAFWTKISWATPTLGFWFTEFLERNAQFARWIWKGRPNCFWMTGFFNPQGLTHSSLLP